MIPGATITARSFITGSENKIAADGEGGFRFAQLLPGDYLVTCIAPGFSPVQQPVIVGPATQFLHLTLNVAGASETVAVTTSTMVEIDTSSTAMGGILDGHEVEAVPLNGRSFTDTLAFAPDVVPVSSAQSNAVVMAGVRSTPPSGDLDVGDLSVSGQRETANGFMVNGSNVVEGVNMGTAIVPNLDSIDQLKVLTNNFDAEYGNYSGDQVVVTTKSGTNDLHGSAFEFLRNTALDARNYFDSVRARYDRNQFGGTLSGRLAMPAAGTSVLLRSGHRELRYGATEGRQADRCQVARTPRRSLQCLEPRAVLWSRSGGWRHQQRKFRSDHKCRFSAAGSVGCQIRFLNEMAFGIPAGGAMRRECAS